MKVTTNKGCCRSKTSGRHWGLDSGCFAAL